MTNPLPPKQEPELCVCGHHKNDHWIRPNAMCSHQPVCQCTAFTSTPPKQPVMLGKCPCLTCSGYCACKEPGHHSNPPQAQDAVEQQIADIFWVFGRRGFTDREAVDDSVRKVLTVFNHLLATARLDSAIEELERLHRYQGKGLPKRDHDNETDELIDERLEQLQAERKKLEGK